jgi:hypothetical protein
MRPPIAPHLFTPLEKQRAYPYLVAASTIATAHAANIQPARIPGSNDYVIGLSGDIAYGDERTFDNVLAGIPRSSNTKIVVMLASSGGNVPFCSDSDPLINCSSRAECR